MRKSPSACVYVVCCITFYIHTLPQKFILLFTIRADTFFPWHDSSSKTEWWLRILGTRIMTKRAPYNLSQLQAMFPANRSVLRGNDRTIELAYSLHRLFLTARSAEAKQEAFDVRLVYFLLGGILNLAFLVLFRVGIDRTREEYEHTSHLMVFRRYKLLYYFDNKFKIGAYRKCYNLLGLCRFKCTVYFRGFYFRNNAHLLEFDRSVWHTCILIRKKNRLYGFHNSKIFSRSCIIILPASCCT